MTRVLLIVDMQNDFITGALGTPEARAIVPTVKRLVKTNFFSDRVFTVDTHYYDYLTTQEGKMLPIPHCMYRSEGWSLAEELIEWMKVSSPCPIIEKSTFACNHMEDYPNELVQADEIFICGLCTDICVVANALRLKTSLPETPIYIIKDATAGTTPEKKEAALSVMESCQMHIISSEELYVPIVAKDRKGRVIMKFNYKVLATDDDTLKHDTACCTQKKGE